MWELVFNTLWEAIVIGFTLSVMPGPALFTILQTSLESGAKAARRLALGIASVDSILITLCIIGASRFLNNPSVIKGIGIGGGILLIVLGIFSIRKKVETEAAFSAVASQDSAAAQDERHQKLPAGLRFYLKGVALDFANPGVWVFWLGTVGITSVQYKTGAGNTDYVRLACFFALVLATALSLQSLYSFGAGKIKSLINDKTVMIVNCVVGAVLIAVGVYLILSAFGIGFAFLKPAA